VAVRSTTVYTMTLRAKKEGRREGVREGSTRSPSSVTAVTDERK